MAYPFEPIGSSNRDRISDPGLKAYLARVYLRLTGGLILSAAIAGCVAYVPALRELFFVNVRSEMIGFTGLGLALLFSPLVVLLVASLFARNHGGRGAAFLYWTLAALVGGSLSLLALIYAGATLVSTLLITAAAFAGLSLWGGITRRNLSGLGSFLVVALFGLILATAGNLVLRSTLANQVMSVLGVLIFAGLIAADTQRLKSIYAEAQDPEALEANANYGALTLYLNFVNLFQFLLSLASGRSRR